MTVADLESGYTGGSKKELASMQHMRSTCTDAKFPANQTSIDATYKKAGGETVRVQLKSAVRVKSASTFYVDFCRRAGTNKNSTRKNGLMMVSY